MLRFGVHVGAGSVSTEGLHFGLKPPGHETGPPLTEVEFQRQVTELAEYCGWSWAHFRPAQTAHGWRTPVSGPLGAGFPDLFMVRERDQRVLLLELKRDGANLTASQVPVVAALRAAGLDVRVLRPRDWPEVEAALR